MGELVMEKAWMFTILFYIRTVRIKYGLEGKKKTPSAKISDLFVLEC
jgi:hypothetical protein